MNWIDKHVRPRLKNMFARRETPDALWIKCPATGELVFHRDVVQNQYVIPNSGYHLSMTAPQRLAWLFDPGTQSDITVPPTITDPLKFRDKRKYTDRLKEARNRTGHADAVRVAQGNLDGLTITAAVQDFAFMGGTLGVAAGNAIITGIEVAIDSATPFVAFTASGGARMQEGMFALMQMPKTIAGVRLLREAGLPYIVVLTHPTTGGVTASFGMLGDVHIAEPGALIGFAGPRVIEQTIGVNLPEGFQRSEFLLEHGMVDIVSHRHSLRATLGSVCRLLLGLPGPSGQKPDRTPRDEAENAGPTSASANGPPAPEPEAINESETGSKTGVVHPTQGESDSP